MRKLNEVSGMVIVLFLIMYMGEYGGSLFLSLATITFALAIPLSKIKEVGGSRKGILKG
jgi:hypothetical protein